MILLVGLSLAVGLAQRASDPTGGGGGGLPSNSELIDDNLTDAEQIDDSGDVGLIQD